MPKKTTSHNKQTKMPSSSTSSKPKLKPKKRSKPKSKPKSNHPLTKTLHPYNNIIVIIGAGISVSSGIPDFRSPQGLYANLDCSSLGLTCPEDLFDLEFFKDNPSPFYKFAKELHPGGKTPTRGHDFLKSLQDSNKLLRIYTQNIDGLESKVGITPSKLCYAHGTFESARCLKCSKEYEYAEIKDCVEGGEVPICWGEKRGNKRRNSTSTSTPKAEEAEVAIETETEETDESETGTEIIEGIEIPIEPRARRNTRSPPSFSSQQNNKHAKTACNGIIKPNITFFGESLSSSISQQLNRDRKVADCLLVIGSSLMVAPVNRVMGFFEDSDGENNSGEENEKQEKTKKKKRKKKKEPKKVLKVLINREKINIVNGGPGKNVGFEVMFLGDIDRVVEGAINHGDKSGSGMRERIGDDGVKAYRFKTDGDGDDSEELKEEKDEEDRVEVVMTQTITCDECLQQINEQFVYNCKHCFDYDLCLSCYARNTITNFHKGVDGESHGTFNRERLRIEEIVREDVQENEVK